MDNVHTIAGGDIKAVPEIRAASLARIPVRFLLLLCLLAGLSSCSRKSALPGQAARTEEDAPLIAVSILPQSWFVSRIGGDRVRILVLVGPGQNPHSYEPAPRQINGLAEAGAWILSGAEFEISFRPKVENLFPRLPIVDGTAGVVFRNLENGENEPEGHFPLEIDRHTWLGSAPARILAAHVRDTLCRIDPAETGRYAANYDTLIGEIDAEFAALRIELAPLKGKSVLVYHPSFGYFLDEFEIRQEAVETGGKEPGPRELNRLIAWAKQEKAAAVFVQAQFPVNAAKTIAEAAGAELVSMDPLAPDWLANIRLMGQALKKAALSAAGETGR